jgi:Spy/CpxP family protein refolding chaperone
MKQGTGGLVLGLAAAVLLAAQALQAQTNKAPGDVSLKDTDERLQRMVAELSLTDEQKAKIGALCRDAAKAAKDATGLSAGTITTLRSSREVERKVMAEVMTEAQRGDVEGARVFQQVSYSVKACEPSPEQIAKIKALCRDAAKGWTAGTDYKVRTAKTKEVIETVKSTVLTEAQRAKLAVPPAAAVAPPQTAPASPTAAPKTP